MRRLPVHAARRWAAGLLLGGSALAAGAAGAADAKLPDRVFKIEPVLLDGSAGGGTALGLQYELKDTLAGGAADAGRGSETLDVEEIKLAGWRAGYRVRGTLTANRADNPKDLQEAQLDAGYRYGGTWGVVLGGLAARYEADQKGNGHQAVIAAQGTYARIGLLRAGDAIALDLRYGQVDPKKDAARQQALGGAPLESYGRWDAEVLYIFPLKLDPLDRIEFNYRYFAEPGAPQAVRDAQLDRHRLLTYRLGLPRDLFIAYSSGKLPFDRSAEKIYEIGLSYQFK